MFATTVEDQQEGALFEKPALLGFTYTNGGPHDDQDSKRRAECLLSEALLGTLFGAFAFMLPT